MKFMLFSFSCLSVILFFPSTAFCQSSGWTDDGSVVRLTNINDNVGIGTTDPGTNRLMVNGHIEATGIRTKTEPLATYPSVYGGYNSKASVYFSNAVTIAGGVSNWASSFSFIGGGFGNLIYSMYSVIAGGKSNRIDNGQDYNVIGGGYSNYIKYNSLYSVIAGGYDNKMCESSSSDVCNYCVIGGGYRNEIYGTSSYSTIAGGGFNHATNDGASICGGYGNTSGSYSSIGGGLWNEATGSLSTVPGGLQNVASGSYSFAAGYGAEANDDYSFVWNDGWTTCESTNTRQFMVCASHGAYFTNEVSALSFDDRPGDYPDLDTAYEAVLSMQRLTEEDNDNMPGQIDISSLSEYVRVFDNEGNIERNLSALVSAHNVVVLDLLSRVEQLESIK